MNVNRVSLAAAGVLSALLLGLAGPVDEAHARSYTAVVKCAKVRISDNNAVDHVEGTGRGNTRPKAVTAAKKNANDKVGRGYRAKHCDVKSIR
ncbi:hypothetical protein [Streptomyces sp. CAU 1734]|uniref:hypothetical protein n=1 Tax=Streptomyces sp. CAU 1734 TaxID=3140360 RepID=UPI003261740C